MDTLKLMMYGKETEVDKFNIVEIHNGKAFTTAGRWYDIICDQCESDYEEISADPESYIVCNICNKVTYLKDLRP